MYLFLLIVFLVVLSVLVFLQQPMFGKFPAGERLERIKKSANYKNGAFQNQHFTPNLTEGVGYFRVIKEVFFGNKTRVSPSEKIPSVKTDLLNLDSSQDVLVWFGHSSYFMQIDGKRMLVDPVFCGSASPFAFGTKAFEGTDVYTPDDIPEIDHLFISHDHWDHLDYKTIKKLEPKIKSVICGLGMGEHLEHWGYDKDKITEKDWGESFELDKGFKVHTVPARHFSGRTLLRNKALWVSFVLQAPTMQIFIGGDSGYGAHFAEIGEKFGPFDLAILENGQYNWKWKYIHLMPDEILKAATELKAKRIFPVHSAKFALASHPWDEPLKKITENNKAANLQIITPMIGEQVDLKDMDQAYSRWWEKIN